MCDAQTLAQVVRLGYTFDHDRETDTWWFCRGTMVTGPYKTMDDAAYAAIADHEVNEAFDAWRQKDAEETQ